MITSAVRWKFFEHRILKLGGLDHSLPLDMVSKKYRKVKYKEYLDLPRKIADKENCRFSEETKSSSLFEVFVERIYDIEGYTPRNKDVVIDVGANVGDTTIWWAMKFGAQVIAFEPMEETFNLLRRNVALNNGDISISKIAIGDGNEISGSEEGTMLVPGKDHKLKTVRLDDLKLERVDLLKIDVEGFELSVLRGAINTLATHKPRVIIETHSKELAKSCLGILTGIGYRIDLQRKMKPSDVEGLNEVKMHFCSVPKV
ncbi:FkbM family methyltransferase [Thermoplasmatales archaeon AK]|nr:FkbM family methyltransferase [Thermoplasmatales archaeon AK]